MSDDKYSHGKIPRIHHEMSDHQDPHSMVKRLQGDQDTVQYYLSMAYYSKDEQKLKECLDRVLIETTKVAMGVQSLIRTLISGAPAVASALVTSPATDVSAPSDAANTTSVSANTAESDSLNATTVSATPAQDEIENVNVVPNEEE